MSINFPVPSRSELRTETRADVSAALEGVDNPLPFSEERAHADAQAALTSGLYGYLRNIADQILPDSSRGLWLWRHVDLWLARGRREATRATGQVIFTGQSGADVPEGTLLTLNGVDFRLLTGVSIGAPGFVIGNVEAVRAGIAGNLLTGVELRLVGTLVGVDPRAVIEAPGFAGGAERESEGEARQRVRARIQRPPHGGADFDYEAWALEVPGCTRAWAYGNEQGIGTVTVRVMFDDVRADNNGFPTAADLQAVTDNIDRQRPVTTAQFFVVGPDPLPVRIVISELIGDTPTLRALIENNIRRVLFHRAEPGARFFGSFITEAISSAAGEEGHRSNVADIQPVNGGSLAFLDRVTYE